MKQLHLALVIVFLALLWPLSAGAAQPAPQGSLPGELIVKLRAGSMLDSDARAAGPGAGQLNSVLRSLGAAAAVSLGPGSDTYHLRVRGDIALAALARRLAANPAVVYAEPNHTRALMRTPDDDVIGQQWALSTIHAFEAWDITTGGDITIALLDSGVSRSHPDLKDKLLPGYDFFNDDGDPSDDNGHGTYTAGVAAASSNTGRGIAGVCWGCKILPVKVTNRNGRSSDATVARGIRWAVDQGARIISMSLGDPEESQAVRDAVTYAHDRNVLVVAASGNGRADGNQPNYPAAYSTVLAVAATARNDVTGFSTTGDYVDISAPGVGVWSTFWSAEQGDTYEALNGTSAACPHVAGAAALLLSLRPDLSADQLAEILEASADDQGAPGRDPEQGYGRLNLLRAVQMAADPNVLSNSRIQGRVVGAPAGVTVALNTGEQAQPDGNGFYSFDNLGAGAYTVSLNVPGAGASPQQAWVSGTALSVATVDFILGADASQFFLPVPASAGDAAYFPETGHTLRGTFRAYWQANGGLPIFGYPTSEEFFERGEDGREYTVQYFERHRLELHPENTPPYHVLLSRLGNDTLQRSGRDWFAFPKGTPQPGCQFFEATGHSLCGAFLSYWRANGLEFDGRRGKSEAESLAMFGQPLSEPQIEVSSDGRQYLVQWFERARFEDHGPQGVLLGLLANDLVQARGWRR
jgi:subtilisin family serine protease